jgi:hypothetical protein
MEKKTIKIEIGKGVTINVSKRKRDKTDIGETIEEIKRGIDNAFVFFDDLKDIIFEIELIYSREEFDKYLKEKTENWVIAHSFKNRFIIFAPEEIEKYTSHEIIEFSQIVCHETCHVLLQKINSKFSFWMFEGIALNIANQIKKGEVRKENLEYFINGCLFKNSNYGEFISHQGYLISYFLMKHFLDNYDRKVVMDLMKISYEENNSVEKQFCEIISMENGEVIDMVKKVLKNKKT